MGLVHLTVTPTGQARHKYTEIITSVMVIIEVVIYSKSVNNLHNLCGTLEAVSKP